MNWNELKHGDKVICKADNSVLTVYVWHEDMYLYNENSDKSDMWKVSEFDPNDWEVVR